MKRVLDSGMARMQYAKRSGEPVYFPLTLREMLDRFGLDQMRWRVRIPVNLLKGPGLRHRLYAYVRAGLGDSPMARDTLRDITDVSKPTQIRGEQRQGASITLNFIRADISTIDKIPCVREGHEGHRAFRHHDSVYLQTANSVSFPAITRRKRVVRTDRRHCSEYRAQQPTNGRRYYATAKRAAKSPTWQRQVGNTPSLLPVLSDEGSKRFGRQNVRIWGLV